MPDDPTHRPNNGIAVSSDRSDDVPSSVRPSADGRRATLAAEPSEPVRGGAKHRAPSTSVRLPSKPYPARHLLKQRTPPHAATVAAVLCCLGLGGAAAVGTGVTSDQTARIAAARSALDQPASRSMERAPLDAAAPAGAAPSTPAATAAAALPPATPAAALPSAAPEPSKKLPPGRKESGPVAGLSHVQMDNAKAIVWTGVDMKMPRRALVIAVATAMQESELLNRASEVLPESKQYPHQGTGWDHDSVGLFQQRTSAGWGSVAQLMDPAYASQAFYRALMQVPGWQQMRLTDAAQTVQVSAFPEAYAKHEPRATQIVNALTDVL
jgi:hypothetical protein